MEYKYSYYICIYKDRQQRKMKQFTSSLQRAVAHIPFLHGVRSAVVSPGSRNASLIEAFETSGNYKMVRVVDERCAGFIALGMASVTGNPVALICTSGTALLNYAPAVAEAYYREIPLIVISADRPSEWIDQNDSQTMRQPGALSGIVKTSYVIGNGSSPDTPWETDRILNDAMLTALDRVKGPVHVNVHLPDCAGGQLGDDKEYMESRMVEMLPSRRDITYNDADRLAGIIASTSRVMVLCTCRQPDNELNKALNTLSALDNVVIVAERVSNVQGRNIVYSPETVISVVDDSDLEQMSPQLLITIGGAPVSGRLKSFLRKHQPRQHWNIGYTRCLVDCYKSLSLRIEADPAMFVSRIAELAVKKALPGDYFMKWNIAANRTLSLTQAYASKVSWSDFKAMYFISGNVPSRWNVQLSNGTSVRYFEFLAQGRYHRVDCNRGVSGIDGSTSTAVGASLAYDGNTLLITGDMSAAYDLGGLALMPGVSGFKMVVLCNDGGNIFRIIRATRDLDVCEPYLSSMPALPLEKLAAAYGLGYYEAADMESLRKVWGDFVEDDRQSILAVKTDPQVSVKAFADYFVFLKNN